MRITYENVNSVLFLSHFSISSDNYLAIKCSISNEQKIFLYLLKINLAQNIYVEHSKLVIVLV